MSDQQQEIARLNGLLDSIENHSKDWKGCTDDVERDRLIAEVYREVWEEAAAIAKRRKEKG